MKNCKESGQKCSKGRVCKTAKKYKGKEWGFCGIEKCGSEASDIKRCVDVGDENEYYKAERCDTTYYECRYSKIRQFRQDKTVDCDQSTDCKRVGNQDEYYDAFCFKGISGNSQGKCVYKGLN